MNIAERPKNRLVLSRKVDEEIYIGDNITVSVVSIKGHTVKLGITAPKDIKVLRDDAVNKERKELP